MSFRNKIQYFLVKKLKISNKEAQELLFSGQVKLNDCIQKGNTEITFNDKVELNSLILQDPNDNILIAYYKPRGIETTLNITIEDNLAEILPFEDRLFPIGRLDKASEGLLLLTNNGQSYDQTLRKEYGIEKEYVVTVDKPITEEFIEAMASGIEIMGKTTLPCKILKTDVNTFYITLTQGLNRQIRRMCYKLNYEVLSLKRIRIGEVELGELKAGEWKSV